MPLGEVGDATDELLGIADSDPNLHIHLLIVVAFRPLGHEIATFGLEYAVIRIVQCEPVHGACDATHLLDML